MGEVNGDYGGLGGGRGGWSVLVSKHVGQSQEVLVACRGTPEHLLNARCRH